MNLRLDQSIDMILQLQELQKELSRQTYIKLNAVINKIILHCSV